MAEKPLPFVITDRRKFTNEGEPRESSESSAGAEELRKESNLVSHHVTEEPASTRTVKPDTAGSDLEFPFTAPGSGTDSADTRSDELPAAPTQEQMEQSLRAFQATADRLDTAIRAANPGADHPPALTFESLIQSVYMQAVLQLGGGTQEGAQPQVDLLGARQSIDMLGILAEKTQGNLSKQEDLLLSSAVFELRLAFLEMTQVLARSAAQRGPGGAGVPPPPGGRPGPSIVR